MDKINKENSTGLTIYDLEKLKMDRKELVRQKRLAFYKMNKGKLIGSGLGLCTLICLFNFGFFRTLGIWLLMTISYTIGAYFDRDVRYINFVRRLFR